LCQVFSNKTLLFDTGVTNSETDLAFLVMTLSVMATTLPEKLLSFVYSSLRYLLPSSPSSLGSRFFDNMKLRLTRQTPISYETWDFFYYLLSNRLIHILPESFKESIAYLYNNPSYQMVPFLLQQIEKVHYSCGSYGMEYFESCFSKYLPSHYCLFNEQLDSQISKDTRRELKKIQSTIIFLIDPYKYSAMYTMLQPGYLINMF